MPRARALPATWMQCLHVFSILVSLIFLTAPKSALPFVEVSMVDDDANVACSIYLPLFGVKKSARLIEQQLVQLSSNTSCSTNHSQLLRSFGTASCTAAVRAGLQDRTELGSDSHVFHTYVSTRVSLPFPNGASWLTRAMSLSFRSDRGRPTFPKPSMCRPAPVGALIRAPPKFSRILQNHTILCFFLPLLP